jgi:hypothetical protein
VGIQLTGCGFFSDSTSSDSILVDGASGFIHTAGTDTVGGDRLNGATNGPPQISPAIQTNVSPAVADPYGGVTFTPPSSSLPCTNINLSTGSATLVSGTRYGQISVSGVGTLTVPAGSAYYLDGSCSAGGNLSITGGTITQTGSGGVTFVLTAQTGGTAGSITITGGKGSLTAPLAANSGLLTTAAASTGLLIFQDPQKSASSGGNTITPGCGSSALTLTGAIDTEKTQDTMQGNPTSCSACLELIANSFHLGGTPLLNINCSGILTASIPGYVIRLVE